MNTARLARVTTIISLLLVAVILLTPASEAACPRSRRTSFTTHWGSCNLSSSFQSIASTAVTTWDYFDTYNYVNHGAGCGYAFGFGQVSFNAYGFGTAPSRTFFAYSGVTVSGAISYFNNDVSWYNSTCNGCGWSNGWFDRGTVAKHEVGHWAQLDHPSSCSQNVPDAMMEYTYWTKLWLREDDKYGLTLLGVRN